MTCWGEIQQLSWVFATFEQLQDHSTPALTIGMTATLIDNLIDISASKVLEA